MTSHQETEFVDHSTDCKPVILHDTKNSDPLHARTNMNSV